MKVHVETQGEIGKCPPRQHRNKPFTNKVHAPWLPSPLTLVQTAGNIVDNAPMPMCWNWDVDDVVRWLYKTVKLPQYRECFVHNYINGRRLLRIHASICPRIGITNFSHIKYIMEEIRQLFNVEKDKYNRSISLPLHYPWTHYLLYKIPTGPMRTNRLATELYQSMGILDKIKHSSSEHWNIINPEEIDFPYNRFGRGINKKGKK